MLKQATQKGYTLIELMVGLAVGLIVVTGLLVGWGFFAQQTTYLARSTNFHQDARAALQLISQDIRRATPPDVNTRALQLVCLDAANGCDPATVPATHGDCVTFRYEREDATSAPAASVVFAGYRIANGGLQAWWSTTQDSNGQCAANNVNWAPVLSPGINNIQTVRLRVSTEPDANTSILNAANGISSRCLEVDVEGAGASDTLERCPTANTEARVELLLVEVNISGTAVLRNGNADNFSFSELVQVRNFEILE